MVSTSLKCMCIYMMILKSDTDCQETSLTKRSIFDSHVKFWSNKRNTLLRREANIVTPRVAMLKVAISNGINPPKSFRFTLSRSFSYSPVSFLIKDFLILRHLWQWTMIFIAYTIVINVKQKNAYLLVCFVVSAALSIFRGYSLCNLLVSAIQFL